MDVAATFRVFKLMLLVLLARRLQLPLQRLLPRFHPMTTDIPTDR
jgi:hypothetical protein